MRQPAALLLAALLAPGALMAWGEKGHADCATLSLEALPPEVRAWLCGQEDVLRDHASDPDRWKAHDRKEGPRHYLDVEVYGRPEDVPQDAAEAVRMIGARAFEHAGLLPWTLQDRYRDLVEAFRSRDRFRIAFQASILCHYVADAHVPLHTTLHHDGLDKAQRGVHARWETGLVERFLDSGSLRAEPVQPEPDPMGAPWRWIRESHALVSRVLEDDRIADRTSPADLRGRRRGGAYWAIYEDLEGRIVKRQLELAAQRTAQLVAAAWVQAGKPVPANP